MFSAKDLKDLRKIDKDDLLELIGLETRKGPSDWLLPTLAGAPSTGSRSQSRAERPREPLMFRSLWKTLIATNNPTSSLSMTLLISLTRSVRRRGRM